MKTIEAVFENGVFRPIEPVELAEGSRVGIEAKWVVPPAEESKGLEATYAILSERYESGRHDVAERHDEHQP
jgi:predicted DNA-binding antitoxin AbrB/MazE fold protein